MATQDELDECIRADIRERIAAIWKADHDGTERLMALAMEILDRNGPNAKSELRTLYVRNPSLRRLSLALFDLEQLGPPFPSSAVRH